MKSIQRLVGLITALVVVCGGFLVVASSAQATERPDRAGSPAPASHHHVHQAAGKISTGGCGFLQLCIYFGRTEQEWIGDIGVAALASAICGFSSGTACGVSGPIAVAATKYIDAHGLCPTSRPRLQVHVLPFPAVNTLCVGY